MQEEVKQMLIEEENKKKFNIDEDQEVLEESFEESYEDYEDDNEIEQ